MCCKWNFLSVEKIQLIFDLVIDDFWGASSTLFHSPPLGDSLAPHCTTTKHRLSQKNSTQSAHRLLFCVCV